MALSIFGNTFEVEKKVLEAAATSAFLYLADDFEVNFRFVSEAQINTLNKVYRRKDKVTDVLSFKLDEDEAGGDVVICYKEAIRRSKEWQMTPTEATALLLVHGILHLSGYDHTTAAERAKMESAEKKILANQSIKI